MACVVLFLAFGFRNLRAVQKPLARFLAGILGIYLFFALILLGFKVVFACANWPSLHEAGWRLIAQAFWKGMRFDAAALGYLLLPALLLYYAAGATRGRFCRRLLLVYGVALSVLTPLVCLADVQYFAESGKHLTYEATAYLNLSLTPIVLGAFQLHPGLSWLSLLACLALLVAGASLFRWLLQNSLPPAGTRASRGTFLTLPIWVALSWVAIHGGIRGRPLHVGNASISANPYINGLCLDPLYAIVRTSLSPARPEFQFYTKESNIRTTRQLLVPSESASLRPDYPLLRQSAGTPQGNGKNVVLFVLESWSGKDVGILGGPKGVTPFFDDLAQQGAFFDHFYATGVRSSEGIFSILCSFPNQPIRPIMDRPEVFRVRWRALSDILATQGYDNIFVHGRDLEFDHLSSFLKAIHFNRLIDRTSFPPSAPRVGGAWPGYDDEEVMRRANTEFASQQGHPFLGVIYTMNTHPPFMAPENYRSPFAPTTVAQRFLNSLNYSDHTLKLFFELARKERYFANTIFLFVADHARTRDEFNFDSQHRIPFLIYAPDYVPPKLNHTIGGQLDVFPTVLGLLQIQTLHASWGQDLLAVPEERGFAISVAGNDVRWHDRQYLLNDSLTSTHPLLFDLIADPACQKDIWPERAGIGEELKRKLRAYLSLSQTLFYADRIFPREPARITGMKSPQPPYTAPGVRPGSKIPACVLWKVAYVAPSPEPASADVR
jgi:phosphoglycerol transferase MdoB-like AlkP superfamily enzyme